MHGGLASEECANLGYGLVTIDDDVENTWLVDGCYAEADESYWWTGLHVEGSAGAFLWEDGNPPAYTNWASGHPDTGPDIGCAALAPGPTYGYTWSNWECEATYNFVCEVG